MGGGESFVLYDGWLRGQSNEQKNAPNPKLSSAAGFSGVQ